MAIHIKAHAEDRKQRSQFTHHEEMNVRADELTNAITPSMPMHASFRRPVTGETTLWYQPTEYENVGRGAMYEVTGNAYKHIALTSQRRACSLHCWPLCAADVIPVNVVLIVLRDRRCRPLHSLRIPLVVVRVEGAGVVCAWDHFVKSPGSAPPPHRGRAPTLLLVLLSCRNTSVVRVCPASSNNPRNRNVLDVGRDVSPHCLQPFASNVGFLGERTREHVPLQLAHLVTVRPLKLLTTVTVYLTRLLACP